MGFGLTLSGGLMSPHLSTCHWRRARLHCLW